MKKTIIKRVKLNFNADDIAELNIESIKKSISDQYPKLTVSEKEEMRCISDNYLILMFIIKEPFEPFHVNKK